MDYGKISFKAVNMKKIDKKNLKQILKFDTGADGFQMMIYVLIAFAIGVLGFGIYFLVTTFKP